MLHHSIRPRTAPQQVSARIVAIRELAPDVRGLELKTSPALAYRAGQYVSLHLPDGSQRSLSPANAPRTDGTILFHVQRRPGGVLTRFVFETAVPGDDITLEGAFGDCVWNTGRNATIMLATGTGIAPLMAMIEESFATPRPITLFWGGRAEADLYAAGQLSEWAQRYAHFRFVPVLSSQGFYVQDAAAYSFHDLSDIDVYACGSPRMVGAARDKLLALPGASAERFFADAFEPSHIPGETLLAALRRAGRPIAAVCGGQASCGTCRVSIAPASFDLLPPPSRTERRLLNCLQGAAPHHRLACQIKLDVPHAGLVVALDPPGISSSDPA